MQFSKEKLNAQTVTVRAGSAYALILVGTVAVVGLAAGFLWLRGAGSMESDQPHQRTKAQPAVDPGMNYKVTISRPSGPPRVLTGLVDLESQPITLACSTCHSTRAANFENKTAADMKEFHSNLSLAHGSISCLSCHNSEDYDALKLADGSRLEYSEVMTLCAQCHGPVMRDFQHGAHGGMTGHWDLTRGPRTRNNCVDCHAPHAPQFPRMKPTFKPIDRFLESSDHHPEP